MQIKYSEDKDQQARDVAEVFKNSGIKRPYEDIHRIQRMIDQSDVLITAWAEGRMVGVARGLTDYAYCCYLSDLAVDKKYQKHGIGKELIARVQHAIGEECSLVLLSAPGAVDYYPRVGFTKSDKAYVIPRKK
ncbi:GNAT family N-acetyltransferase [Paenibacillus lemnae]|uniref:GNAT family N-acetyltransferase n=1 Tax=Paenibacillus lemnae TaxID=1330551 RepID=A0A848M5Y5_PAELE|nr:GNAT family N-acetyltransferase [Paenibacillus lemnae]NMO96558.1 GNAT family N-acetyltransferase [Paenibacillus lemnae]